MDVYLIDGLQLSLARFQPLYGSRYPSTLSSPGGIVTVIRKHHSITLEPPRLSVASAAQQTKKSVLPSFLPSFLLRSRLPRLLFPLFPQRGSGTCHFPLLGVNVHLCTVQSVIFSNPLLRLVFHPIQPAARPLPRPPCRYSPVVTYCFWIYLLV